MKADSATIHPQKIKGSASNMFFTRAKSARPSGIGTQHPWEIKRVWHIELSLTDPDTACAGVEDAAIFKTTDVKLDNWN